MKQGWSRILLANGGYTKKWHYFVDGRSLCNRYMKFTDEGLDDTIDISKDNCFACQKKKVKVTNLPEDVQKE